MPFVRQSTHLVSLYTEGPPRDEGSNLSSAASKFRLVASKYFDSARFETPAALIGQDSSWTSSFRDFTDDIVKHPDFSPEIKWNPLWARTGLFGWKPRLIRETLETEAVSPKDIVFYHDSDVDKYPEYLVRVPRWGAWLRSQMRHSDILVFRDNRALLVSDTKPELWQQFFDPLEVSGLRHVWAGAFAVKKTKPGIQFVRRWEELATEPGNLLPVSRLGRSAGLSRHSNEQAILACLRHCQREWPKNLRLKEVYLKNSRTIPPTR